MNKQIVILTFSFVLIFSIGVYLGSAFKITDHSIVKRQNLKRVRVSKSPKFKPLLSKDQITTVKDSMKVQTQNDPTGADPQDCYYDSDFDSRSFEDLYAEETEKWNQSLKEMFSERTAYPEQMLEDYDKIKEERNLAHQKLWEKNKEKTKISENTYAYFPSWEDDQERFAIDRKYQEDLKKFLGPNDYEKLQKKINAQFEVQIKKARNGEPYVAGFDY